MIELPCPPMALPPGLTWEMNGAMPIDLMVEVETGMWMHVYAAPAWKEFRWHIFLKYGWILTAEEAYRNEETQRYYFYDRYTTDISKADMLLDGVTPRSVKRYQGRSYYILPGKALAAAPKTSSHGFGLAVDARERLADGTTVALTEERIEQLVAEAYLFGFGWESQSEPWHLRYVLGYQWPTTIEPPKPTEEQMAALHRIISGTPGDAEFIRFDSGRLIHVGPGESAAWPDVPVFVEGNPDAYIRLCEASGTSWRPAGYAHDGNQ